MKSICNILIFVSIIFSCTKTQEVEKQRITILSKEEIQPRISYTENDSVSESDMSDLKKGNPIATELKFKGKVRSPQFDGTNLQATHIALTSNYAFISYNMVGDPYIGAYDIVDISDPDKAELISSVIFSDTDINTIFFDPVNDKLYMATATSNAVDGSSSVIEIMDVEGSSITLETERIGVSGYAATDAKVRFNKLFAISGNNAGITVFNESSHEFIEFIELEDARAIEFSRDYALVLQGTPARLNYYAPANMAFVKSFTFNGANTPEAKSSFQIYQDKFVFIAAGEEGVIISDFETGEVKDIIPIPDALGSHDSVASNAVAIQNNYIFIANGEAGVSLAEFDEETGEATWLGRTNFQAKESANFVVAKNGWIFVARGSGGFQILQLRD